MKHKTIIELSNIETISSQIKFILTKLRNETTENKEFRYYLSKFGELAGIYILNFFQMNRKNIITGNKKSYKGLIDFTPQECNLISILRAGEPLRQGVDKTLRTFGINPKNSYASIKRAGQDPKKRWNFSYNLSYLSNPSPDKICIIADPMLATGGTFIAVIKKLKSLKCMPKQFFLVSCIASHYGISTLNKYLTSQKIKFLLITGEIDTDGINHSGLDKKGYIVPGLGDAGDRSHD